MDYRTHVETWTNLDGDEGFQTPEVPSYIHNHSGSARTIICVSPIVHAGLDTTNTGDADSRFGIDLGSISATAANIRYIDSTTGGIVGRVLLDDADRQYDSNLTSTSFSAVATTALSGSGSGAELTVNGSGDGTTYTISGVSFAAIGSGYQNGDQLQFTLTQATKDDLTVTLTLDNTVLTPYVLTTSSNLSDTISSVSTTTVSGSGTGAVLTINGDTLLNIAGDVTEGLYVIDSIDVSTAGSGYQQGDRISFTVGDYTLNYDITNVLHSGQATLTLADGGTTPFLASEFKDNTAASDDGGQFTTYA